MATANVQLVRSIYAAWERGDFRSVEWADPEIEYVIADGPAPGSWTGLAAMAESVGDYLGAWEDYRIKAEQYSELEDARVLVFARVRGRGKMSGLDLGEMRTKAAHVFDVRSGEVTRFVVYLDREDALADLGLAPKSGSLGA